MGDKIGRIHLGKQDLGELQTRKMKGLKRGRDIDTDGAGEDDGTSMISEREVEVSGIASSKKSRIE